MGKSSASSGAPPRPTIIGNSTPHNSATIDGDRRLFGAALRALSSSQKRGDGEPAYLRWINRPLGRLAAAVAYKMRLSPNAVSRSEEHTSELQSRGQLVCRLLLDKKHER